MKKLHAVCLTLTLLAVLFSIVWGHRAKAPVHPQSVNNPGIAPIAKLKGGPDWPLCPPDYPSNFPFCQ